MSHSSPSTPRGGPRIVLAQPLRIVVLGGTGTAGALTINSLATSGINLSIRAACYAEFLHSTVTDSFINNGVEVVAFDYNDPASLLSAMKEMDRVVVVLPWCRGKVPMMENVLLAAKQANIKFILKLSTVFAENESVGQVCAEHAQCDDMVKQSGIPYAIIKPCPTMDMFLMFQGSIIKADKAVYGMGKCGVAFVDSRDVADCVVAVILNIDRFSNEEFVLSGKQALTGVEVAAAMSTVYGTHIEYRPVDETRLREVMTRRGIPQSIQDDKIQIQKAVMQGLTPCAEVTHTVKAITGHPPRTMESFLAANRSHLCPSFSFKQFLHFFI